MSWSLPRRTSHGSGAVAAASACRRHERRVPAGRRRCAHVHGRRRRAAPSAPTRPSRPCASAEPLGVGRRELDALASGTGSCSAGETSTSGAAQIERNVPEAQRAVGVGARPRRAGGLERRRARGRGPARGGLALRPAHARARRSPRASGRRRTAPPRRAAREAIGPVSDAESRPEARARGRRAPTTPRALARAADRRAQALHAPVGVRDACPPSRRRTRRGKTTSRARAAPR